MTTDDLIYHPQHQCFIRKNTPELRQKLIALDVFPLHGYDVDDEDEWLYVGDKRFSGFGEGYVDYDEDLSDYGIDCGTNEELFLSLAFREPKDYDFNYMAIDMSTNALLDKFIGEDGTPERQLFQDRVNTLNKYFDTHAEDDIVGALHFAGMVPPKHKTETLTLDGFVARDLDNSLTFFTKKPYRFGYQKWFNLTSKKLILPSDSYPEVRWEDDPLPVTLTITSKQL